jgi:hypothetical protein
MTVHQPKSPAEELVEFLLYAPIGLAFSARELAPQLVAKGRQQVAVARVIGEMVVQQGGKAVGQRLHKNGSPSGAADSPTADAPTTTAAGEPAIPETPDAEPVSDASHLAIADYDLLAAAQIVGRLSGLSPTELSTIESYETTHRGRRTILAKIAQLRTA